MYSFPQAVVEAIAEERYRHPDPRVQQGMEILWLKSKNETHADIAELANVSRSTVQRTLRIYAARGLDGIRLFGWKGQPNARFFPFFRTTQIVRVVLALSADRCVRP